MRTKITIVIPNYNKAEYLKECIDSVKRQTCSDFECIIVDDRSTDGSKQIIEQECKDDNRFKVFFNQNAGVAAARNFGITHASNEFVMPLDADDYIEKTYVQRASAFFDQFPDYTLYYGKWVFIGFNADDMNARLGNLHFADYRTLLRGNSIHCSCVYRKADAISCGLFDSNMKGYEDWEFLIRLLHGKPKVFWDQNASLFYRQLEKSRTTDDHANYQQRFNDIVNKNIGIYREYFNI